jgi:hypothetical protein
MNFTIPLVAAMMDAFFPCDPAYEAHSSDTVMSVMLPVLDASDRMFQGICRLSLFTGISGVVLVA